MKTKEIIRAVEGKIHKKYLAGSIDSELVVDCIIETIKVIKKKYR